MIQLELYHVFREVAKWGSFSEAARKLFISQPAVSQAVGQLESGLGRKLFSRGRHGAVLTKEGKMLYEHVTNALDILEAGEARFTRMRGLKEGNLSIGAGDTVSEHYLLPHLRDFQESYPQIRLQVINRTTTETIALLKAGKVDLAFVNLPLEDSDIQIMPCMEIHDVFVASQKYASLKNRPIFLGELSRMRLVMLETISNSRMYVDAFFRENEAPLTPEIELGAHSLLLEFARSGLGIACVIREFSKNYLSSGELFVLPLAPPIPPRSIGLCTLNGTIPSFAVDAFIRELRLSNTGKNGLQEK